jgi:hypothetical protein
VAARPFCEHRHSYRLSQSRQATESPRGGSLDVYRTAFSVPLRQLGRKSIVAPISGPPAETVDDVRSCGDRCTSNLRWHGTVRLTLVRTVSTGA